MSASITSHIDVAQVALYAFWLFFAGLIFYLRREDRREGYPLISEVSGKPYDEDSLLIPQPKIFKLADGSEYSSHRPDQRELRMAPTQGWSGSPYEPTGDAMVDGIGPAAWAERSDRVEPTFEGLPKIVPMRILEGYEVYQSDVDPRGLPVKGLDGETVGRVTDMWLDRGEAMIRYLEIELDKDPKSGEGSLLLPMPMARITGWPAHVKVHSIRSDQFGAVPRTKSKEQVTLLEEDKIGAYYSGGYLYAKQSRMGPLV
jgi:photosynthetic reaction center H subunit